jgi:O-antigen/teichoic acid export membrane protein
VGIVQRQGIINSIITYAGIAIGFISLLVIQPRFLTTEEIGLTRVLFSFSALVATFMPFGMNSITLKYFPYFRNRDKGHYGFFMFMLLLPLAGFLVIGLLLWFLKGLIIAQYVEQSALFTEYFYYIFPLTFFLSLISVLNAYSYSLFKTSFPGLLNDVVVRLISIGLFTLYFIKQIDRDQFVTLFTAIYGLQLVVLVIYIFIVDKPSLKIDRAFLKEQQPSQMMKYGILLSFAALSSLGLKYLDVVMLGKYVPLSLVGIYAICAFIPSVIEAPLGALEKIGLAKISDAWSKNNMADIREIYFKSSKYLFLAGGLLFLGINLNLDSLFLLIPKQEFAQGKYVVLIISVGTLINMATGTNDSIIYTSQKYIYGTYMLILLFILAFVNNLVFIPWLGINGAALATALSAFIFNMMKYFFIWKNFNLQPFTRETAYIIVVIIITYLLVSILPVSASPLIEITIRSVLVLAIYTMLTFFLKIVPEFHHLIPGLSKKQK